MHYNYHVSMLSCACDNGSGVLRPAFTVIACQNALDYTVETIPGHMIAARKLGNQPSKVFA